MVYAVESRQLELNSICVSRDEDIHQMSNLQADDADLVTLHIYSPPLLSMNAYSLSEATVSQFVDPINEEFVGGGGI
jgi:cysteine dioxygenase